MKTPRTDKAVLPSSTAESYVNNYYDLVDAEIARQLERDLNKALADLEACRLAREQLAEKVSRLLSPVTYNPQEDAMMEKIEKGVSISAQALPVSHFVKEEMMARGWNFEELLNHLPGDRATNSLTLQIMFATPEFDHELKKDMRLGEEMARILATGFGTSKEFWLNLDIAWLKHQNK